jgi:glycosyltransferase involved in cell wall biosynthesis
MKLLICAQAVDRNDPVLGFFHAWLVGLAAHYETVTVICLRQGEHQLPANVRVFALGGGKLSRLYKLLRGAYRFRGNYDAVLVHMSQEFVLGAGWLWRVLGKRVYLWRNHYAGSLLTDLAALFCTKVFYTSKFSYTAKYQKAVRMPVGVDTQLFKPVPGVARESRSVLFLGRMAPSKRPELLLEALKLLQDEGVEYRAALYGSPLPHDREYYERLKLDANHLHAAFYPAVANRETPAIYSRHAVFVNCSPSGMFDKTLFEAAACGCRVLAASEDWAALAGEDTHFDSAEELAAGLKAALAAPQPLPAQVLEQHSLQELCKRLSATIR